MKFLLCCMHHQMERTMPSLSSRFDVAWESVSYLSWTKYDPLACSFNYSWMSTFIDLFVYLVCVCVDWVCLCVPPHMCGARRQFVWGQFSPSTTCARDHVQVVRFVAKRLYPLSLLAKFSYIKWQVSPQCFQAYLTSYSTGMNPPPTLPSCPLACSLPPPPAPFFPLNNLPSVFISSVFHYPLLPRFKALPPSQDPFSSAMTPTPT